MLAHSAKLPADVIVIGARIPQSVSIRTIEETDLPATWSGPVATRKTKDIGTSWAKSGATAVLSVPSVVVPNERNLSPESGASRFLENPPLRTPAFCVRQAARVGYGGCARTCLIPSRKPAQPGAPWDGLSIFAFACAERVAAQVGHGKIMRQISRRGRCFCYTGTMTPGPDYHEQRFYDLIGSTRCANAYSIRTSICCAIMSLVRQIHLIERKDRRNLVSEPRRS